MSLTLQVGLAVITFTASAATRWDKQVKSNPELPKSKEKPTFYQWAISYIIIMRDAIPSEFGEKQQHIWIQITHLSREIHRIIC